MKLTNKRRKELERELRIIGSVAAEDNVHSTAQVHTYYDITSKVVVVPILFFIFIMCLFLV